MAILAQIQLTQLQCPSCNAPYAISEDFRSRRWQDGKSWNCPYCDIGISYRDNENARLKKQLAAEQQRANALSAGNDQLRAELRDAKTNAKRQITRAKNETRRLEQRAAAGVCPCCNRTFQQLARHMKSQHPDHVAATLT
jgi:hypothetical protein